MKKHLTLDCTAILFIALVAFSRQAADGARQGLSLCGNTLAPSLFPFFVLSNLLSALGLPDLLGQKLEPLARRIFRVSGCGRRPFFWASQADIRWVPPSPPTFATPVR